MRRKLTERVIDRITGLKMSASAPPPIVRTVVENRRTKRRSCYKIGHVVFEGYDAPCVVRDISPKGARVSLQGVTAFPALVTLTLEETRARQKARVAWQTGTEAGLAF